MPPEDDESCTYREYGSCKSPLAQLEAINSLHKKIAGELKERTKAINDAQ
jgi:hypothetical protein